MRYFYFPFPVNEKNKAFLLQSFYHLHAYFIADQNISPHSSSYTERNKAHRLVPMCVLLASADPRSAPNQSRLERSDRSGKAVSMDALASVRAEPLYGKPV